MSKPLVTLGKQKYGKVKLDRCVEKHDETKKKWIENNKQIVYTQMYI